MTASEERVVPERCAFARARRFFTRAWSRARRVPEPVRLKRFAIGTRTRLSRTCTTGVAFAVTAKVRAKSTSEKKPRDMSAEKGRESGWERMSERDLHKDYRTAGFWLI